MLLVYDAGGLMTRTVRAVGVALVLAGGVACGRAGDGSAETAPSMPDAVVDAKPVPEPPPTLAPTRISEDLQERLVQAPRCYLNELGGSLYLDFESDGTFSWVGGGSRSNYSGGRWDLRGSDIRLRGKIGGEKHTTICHDATVLGVEQDVQVISCMYGFTFFCGIEPGPVVFVQDGGAGEAAVERVSRILTRHDGPNPSYAFPTGPAEGPSERVTVFHRGDPGQAGLFAAQLEEQLDTEVAVTQWPKAPSRFVVVVGGGLIVEVD